MPDVMPNKKLPMRQAKPAGPRGAWTAALRARRTASPMRFRVVSTRLLPSRASGDG